METYEYYLILDNKLKEDILLNIEEQKKKDEENKEKEKIENEKQEKEKADINNSDKTEKTKEDNIINTNN